MLLPRACRACLWAPAAPLHPRACQKALVPLLERVLMWELEGAEKLAFQLSQFTEG